MNNSHIKYTYHVYDNKGIFLVSCVGLESLYEVIGISEREYFKNLNYDYNTQAKFSWFNYRVFPVLNKSLENQIKDKEIKRVRSKIKGISETRYYKINDKEIG